MSVQSESHGITRKYSEADMVARVARDRRVQTAAEALGIGFFYLGMLAFFVYTLRQALESGLL